MTDGKEYQKAIEVCTTLSAWSTKQGKFTVLALATEDDVFRDLLETAKNGAYRAHVRLASMKPPQHTGKAIAPPGEPVFANLVAYCEKQLASQKPQWQNLAERHGWAPVKP